MVKVRTVVVIDSELHRTLKAMLAEYVDRVGVEVKWSAWIEHILRDGVIRHKEVCEGREGLPL